MHSLSTSAKILSIKQIFLSTTVRMTSNTKLLLIYLNCLFLILISTANCQILLAYENNPQSLKHLKAAKVYVNQGAYQQAKIELEAGLKNDPKSPDILNNLGAIYLRLGQNHKDESKCSIYLEKAKTYFSQALDADPNFSSAWNGLADTYYLEGHAQQAISYYKKALSLSPKHACELQTNLANAQRDLALLPEAKDNYQKAIVSNPLYAPAHNGYAELLLSQNDLSQAYSEILKAIKIKPDYAGAYYHLGLIESARGNKNQALKAYLLSLRYETNSTYAQETQALIDKLGLDSNNISFAELKKFQAELSQPVAIISSDKQAKFPSNQESLNKNNSSIKNTSDAQQSIASIELLIVDKQWTKANKEVSRLLKVHPDDAVLLNELGLILFNEKKYTSAEKALLEGVAKSDKKLAAAYYNLGQVYLAKHNLSKAQSMFENAKSLAKEQSENYALIDNALAILFKQNGDLDSARSTYEEAIKMGGNNYPVIHYNLAILLEQIKKPKEATQEFNTYLQLAPHGLNAIKAQKYLKSIAKD